VNYQDYLLQRFPAGGWFVEAGAHDGVGDSQTLRLEQAGWQGLCVEPSSAYHGLTLSRKCKTDNRVLSTWSKERCLFREMHGEAVELSGLVRHFQDDWDRTIRPHTDRRVWTVNLTDLLIELQAPPVIEFLCLDTEGSEWQILFGHDFNLYRLVTILVEYNGLKEYREQLQALLESQSYWQAHDDGTNLFFMRKDMP
jgi:hypothetical protein